MNPLIAPTIPVISVSGALTPALRWIRAKDYLDTLCDTLAGNHNFADKIRPGTRCITLDYARDFHLDLVPRVTRQGGHFICNRETNCFEKTDGTGYRNWFSEQSRITRVNLKRSVRLLKFVRDRQHNYFVKSILLTTLADKAIHPSDRGEEAVRTVADTLTTILTRMDGYLQRHEAMPDIINPAFPSEDFNRHWSEERYSDFRERVHFHIQIAQEALACPSIEESIRTWRRLLGNNFGKGRLK